MPRLCLNEVHEGVVMGLWAITETIEDMFVKYPYLESFRFQVESRYKSNNRILEFLAIRALLHQMCGGRLEIKYQIDGSPYIDGLHCSISHTKGYAVLILSHSMTVGVDIEYITERVNRIADRFVRSDEVAETTLSKLIHWTVKEALFKVFHEDKLDYQDMKVIPFSESSQGIIHAENLKRKIRQELYYYVNDNYVLTYCFR